SRRISRPRTRQLNPFPSYSDPLNLRVGNPFLLPEYTNSLELSYAHQTKKTTLTSSLYYKDINDVISRVKTVDTLGVSTLTYSNLSSMESYGLEVILVSKLSKAWSMNLSGNAFQTRQEVGDRELGSDLNTSAIGWSAKAMSTWKLDHDLQIQVSARYRAPRLLLQGDISAMWWADLAAKKGIFDNKGSIGIRVTDVFNTREFTFYSFGTGFEQESLRKRESQNVFLTFSYNFGKLEERSRRGGSRDVDGGGMDEIGID
ncbi:MAG: TonB-dependent receptor, partial [Flavobacteriales bacterium]|nr:TonB-dependent receptor [Flavobacteriales bacterium]